MRYLLGLDIGTSGTKTALFDEDGKTIATATFGYDLFQPKVGYAEQNPDDWWDACVKGIRAVIDKSNVQSIDIKGIGLSGQMHGLVLLDKDNKVIRKSIIWCDQRTEKECEYITEKIGKERLIKITGNPAMTGFTLSKLLWVRNNEPENYKKINKILLPKDYIRFKLTNVFATEVSDASGMQMLDINTRSWSDELLNDLEIDKNILADVYESVVVSGKVSSEAAELTNLSEGTPVVGGAGDQAAGAIGSGIVKEGVISTVIGTSGVVFASTDTPKFDKDGRVHTLCHAVPGKWHVMGVTQGAGLSLNWFKKTFCAKEIEDSKKQNVDVYDLLTQEAAQSKPGSNGVTYLPYLMGERTPHLDPNVKGGFFGVSLINNHNDFVRSVLEGVSFSLKNCLDIIEDMNVKVEDVRVSGGGAESAVWRQILADIFQYPLNTVKASEGGALGVAILAGVGAGIYPSVEEACERIIEKADNKVTPNTELRETYEKVYAVYNSLYERIKDI
ncbi:MAG TPA: xylulokinase [Clostridium sp.]|nr:xylulokinase [Clostridium sp.]